MGPSNVGTSGLSSPVGGGRQGREWAPPTDTPPYLNTRPRLVRRARREPKMAACGRVRRMFRLSAALQLLLLAAAGAQKLLNQGGHGQGQGQGAGFGGGGPAGQQLLQLPQSSQHQQQPPQQPPQPPFPAGGPPARRGGAGPGGAGGGWKLAEEEFCREDVTRVCPKHTWSNNLAVLECLQDVREVRRRDGAGRARPGAGPRVSPASKPRVRVGCRARSPVPGAFRGEDPTPRPPSFPPQRRGLEALSVLVFALGFCVPL